MYPFMATSDIFSTCRRSRGEVSRTRLMRPWRSSFMRMTGSTIFLITREAARGLLLK